jgi:choline-glycine betaine transporter
LRLLLRLQAVYYGVTGIWPFVHYPSFEAVTGPKTDDWLVLTVGALLVVVAAALWLMAGETRRLSAAVLAMGTPLAFIGIELAFALPGRIDRIYLADAAVQACLVVALAVLFLRQRSG